MCKYAVVDLEMCRTPRSNRIGQCKLGREVIQIGTVLLDESFNEVDEFCMYVAPEFGYIDSYISKLTGINNEDVKDADSFADMISKFVEWLPDDTKFVSWSTTDSDQLRRECEAKQIESEKLMQILNESIDCQKMFGDKIDINRPYKLEEALYITDVCEEGRLHDGLVDAKNTAKLFSKLMTEKEFTYNKFYQQAHDEEISHLSSTLGSLLSGLKLECA